MHQGILPVFSRLRQGYSNRNLRVFNPLYGAGHLPLRWKKISRALVFIRDRRVCQQVGTHNRRVHQDRPLWHGESGTAVPLGFIFEDSAFLWSE